MTKPRLKVCTQCGQKKVISADRSLCQGCRKLNTDVKAGRVHPPEYEDFKIEGYKEPLEKVTEGFGYYGTLAMSNDEETIQCHICGYFFKSVASHVGSKHKVAPRDYKMAYGLRVNDGLLAPKEKERYIQRYNENARFAAGSHEASQKAQKSLKEKREAGEIIAGGAGWPGITRNEKGMCKEQILAKIRHIADNNRGVVTRRLMIQDYGKLYDESIHTLFGGWKEALKAAKAINGTEAIRRSAEKQKKDVPKLIKEFYKRTGHPPYSSDFDSNDNLPNHKFVARHFGSLNNARAQAGVPLVVWVNGKWEEVII